MRLNQFLARAGLGSRRACEDLITSGQVFINGQRVSQLAVRVGPTDSVSIAGKKLHVERSITAMLHKPRGYLCSTVEEGGSRTIYDLLPHDWPRVFYIGRLDLDSEGLLLLTNNGALSQKLTHPSYKLPKVYEVLLNREFDYTLTEHFRKGILIEGKLARMESLHRMGPRHVKVILTQGIKRQIRLMFEERGYTVERLIRTQIGRLMLGDLPPGKWKILNEHEVAKYFGGEAPVLSPERSSSPSRPALAPRRPYTRPRPADAERSSEPGRFERRSGSKTGASGKAYPRRTEGAASRRSEKTSSHGPRRSGQTGRPPAGRSAGRSSGRRFQR